jgi:hypothetical protein
MAIAICLCPCFWVTRNAPKENRLCCNVFRRYAAVKKAEVKAQAHSASAGWFPGSGAGVPAKVAGGAHIHAHSHEAVSVCVRLNAAQSPSGGIMAIYRTITQPIA